VTQFVSQLIANTEWVGTLPVTFVDERNPRNVVALHLAVDSDRLRLNAGDGAQNQNGTIENTKSTLHLYGEVHVSGGVNDIDVVALPLAVCRGGLNRDASLTLELHGVHLRSNAVFTTDIVDGMDPIGVEQNALCQGGLTGVNVSANSDVPKLVEWCSHGIPLMLGKSVSIGAAFMALEADVQRPIDSATQVSPLYRTGIFMKSLITTLFIQILIE
jgi:hypothetical protein